MTAQVRQDGPVYGTVWIILMALLRVPRTPPELPVAPGETVDAFHPAPGYLRYKRFRLNLLLASELLGVITAGVPVLVSALVSDARGIASLAAGITAVFWVAHAVIGHVWIRLRYDTTWYVMNQRSVRLRTGILLVVEQTFTFENVQNVKVTQGPIQRHYGIADVVLETAGGGGATGQNAEAVQFFSAHRGLLFGLDAAEQVRDLILSRIGRQVSAGLGDDGEAIASGRTWRPEHIRRLREIRDELRGMATGSC